MKNSFFYSQIEKNQLNTDLLNALQEYSNENSLQMYAIIEPLGEEKYNYEYTSVVNVLIPGYKLLMINLGGYQNKDFEYFYEDFVEDLSHISDKFTYKEKIGRPRDWKREQIERVDKESFDIENFIDSLEQYKHTDSTKKRISELLISLLIGSVNSIDGINIEEPENLLEKVKQKIVLFDSDQTRFIFEKVEQDRVTIQGLAGTGKTELLLHKLKELYTKDNNSKIVFTCHSRTLASNLKKRVPDFFTFMKVDEQIQWEERLWVHHSWGSQNSPNSGLYSLICDLYNISFYRWSRGMSFSRACSEAIRELEQLQKQGLLKPYFDYILIDESQDFTEEFFKLCEMVTKKTVFVAGDIFQNIFDNDYSKVNPDFLLNKCYRTDPRTLMFAHAVGLGLFERPVVNWLNDQEWESCGYQIQKQDTKYNLTREKIRRFEGIENLTDIKPVELYCEKHENLLEKVVDIIENVRSTHPTVTPNEIGIVFIDDSSHIYGMIDYLEVVLQNTFDWEVNRGFENKGQIDNTIFVSNRNNIKGLEFPFLICVVTNEIGKNIKSRNTLYMTLTRSFISSYLVMSDINEPLFEVWNSEFSNIIDSNSLRIIKPKVGEIMSKEELQISEAVYRTYQEIIEDLFIEFKIEVSQRDQMLKILAAYSSDDERQLSEDFLRKIIKQNLGILNERDI
ncbi:AAA family ATPase [Bacillus cereus]|uniref:AAA family ATPase n=1 Tax=Bacillus cereus TaxID=1396 RepID=UPI000BFC3FA0|nr:AAA family ATPase [Bacillus cereus]PGR66389.1 hypothetical protein COC49_10520 [Bacillus cereus]